MAIALVMRKNDNNMSNTVWLKPPFQPRLGDDRVHVWCASLKLPTNKIARLTALLSSNELARADKFYFPEHKERFIAARGILRQLLGSYLKISPKEIEFEYSDRGKPRLASSMVNSSLQFNVSHSLDYALYGFGNNYLIGVDLEYLREMEDVVELAKRFFTHREYQLITNLSGKEQQKAFFQLWTAKEAYLKAIGTGLSDSLTDIELTSDGINLKLQAINGNVSDLSDWSMYHFAPAANYVSTIIVNTRIPKQQIDFWSW